MGKMDIKLTKEQQQMLVAGVVRQMTAESAKRAALGAGAIVMDVIASNDQRRPHDQIQRIRELRPDMILISGGTDGGTTTHVVEIAELIAPARPQPRFGRDYRMPIIYAGNNQAAPLIENVFDESVDLAIVDNLRPVLERENLGPARDKIHDLFLEHVMAHAPGYDKLMGWVDAPIMPTPGAVGSILRTIAEQQGIHAVGVDIGGATTDVFSVFDGTFNRTVSANLGLSYSISNVCAEAGMANILRWVHFDMDERELRNRVKNKMIRPTTIPQTAEALIFEQAVARAAEADPWLRDHPPVVEWWGGQFEPARIPADHPLVETVTGAFGDATGAAAHVEGMTYGADMRLLVNVASTPTLLFGPGDVRNSHRPNEYVPVEELVAAVRTLALTALRFCGYDGR